MSREEEEDVGVEGCLRVSGKGPRGKVGQGEEEMILCKRS